MNIYDRISRMTSDGSYEEKMYQLLLDAKYQKGRYKTRDAGDGMAIVYHSILEWWKPRFLMDHRTRCAYEFMDSAEYLVNVQEEDIDWASLSGLPEECIQRAHNRYAHFPTLIYEFNNGVAIVQWQLNPDGLYYQDEYGFGMTDDVEIALWGKIDREGNVVTKFKFFKH